MTTARHSFWVNVVNEQAWLESSNAMDLLPCIVHDIYTARRHRLVAVAAFRNAAGDLWSILLPVIYWADGERDAPYAALHGDPIYDNNPVISSYRSVAKSAKTRMKNADAVRDIMGNPWRRFIADTAFCSVCGQRTLPECHGAGCGQTNWRAVKDYVTPQVRRLAEAAYPYCEPEQVSVLRDCLMDHGMVDGHPLVAHLAQPRHWTGCWAIDLLTGRS